MRILRYAAAIAAALLLGCTGGSACTPSGGDAAPEQNEVTSVLTDLTLEHLTVEVGTTVKWTNEDPQYHTNNFRHPGRQRPIVGQRNP